MASTFRLEGNTLADHGDGLYTLDGSLKYNFVAPAIARFPCRMAVMKLSGGGLFVWSPFPPTPDVFVEILTLDEPVSFVMAPNSIHWLWAGSFAAACRQQWPGHNLCLCASPGLPYKTEAKAAMVANGWKWDAVLPTNLPSNWPAEDISLQHVRGIPQIEEVVLLHRPSRSLIAAELAFNFQQHDSRLDVSWPMTWYLQAMDGYRPCCPTRTFRFLTTKPELTVRDVQHILSNWDFGRFVPAHGRIVSSEEAKPALERGALSLFSEMVCGVCLPPEAATPRLQTTAHAPGC